MSVGFSVCVRSKFVRASRGSPAEREPPGRINEFGTDTNGKIRTLTELFGRSPLRSASNSGSNGDGGFPSQPVNLHNEAAPFVCWHYVQIGRRVEADSYALFDDPPPRPSAHDSLSHFSHCARYRRTFSPPGCHKRSVRIARVHRDSYVNDAHILAGSFTSGRSDASARAQTAA